MNKKLLLIPIAAMLLISFVAADMVVTYNFKDEKGDYTNNVNGLVYSCLDSDCASVKLPEWVKVNSNSYGNNYDIEILSSELSEKIFDTDDSIIGKLIECKDAQKCAHRCVGAFKITQMELQFYKRFNIPLPRICPNCRFYTRMQKLNQIIFLKSGPSRQEGSV